MSDSESYYIKKTTELIMDFEEWVKELPDTGGVLLNLSQFTDGKQHPEFPMTIVRIEKALGMAGMTAERWHKFEPKKVRIEKVPTLDKETLEAWLLALAQGRPAGGSVLMQQIIKTPLELRQEFPEASVEMTPALAEWEIEIDSDDGSRIEVTFTNHAASFRKMMGLDRKKRSNQS